MMAHILKKHPNYEITENGDVRRIDNGYILQPSAGINGPKVCLDGEQLYISRLVAEYFLGEPRPGAVVMHMDGDKTNNHYKNLVWVSRSYLQYKVCSGRRANRSTRPISVMVIETGIVYSSMAECARDIGCSVSAIRHVVNGDRKTIFGFHIVCI